MNKGDALYSMILGFEFAKYWASISVKRTCENFIEEVMVRGDQAYRYENGVHLLDVNFSIIY